MYYYIIGFLILLFARMYVNISYAERRIQTNMLHESGTVVMGMYLIFVYRYLSVHLLSGTGGSIVSAILFLPMGFFLPLLFVRYRSVLLLIINQAVCAGLISVCQIIMIDKTNFINILFMIVGAIAGYLVFRLNSMVFETVKRGFLIKRRKKMGLSVFLTLEGVFILALVAAMFIVGNITYSVAEGATVQDDGKLKEMKYEESYSDLYYAEEKNYDRYDAYALLHPDMSMDEVVWRVEANLDKPFYSDVTEYDSTEKYPLLLNKYHRVSDNYEPDNLVTVYDNFLATPDTKAAFEQMRDDMNALGYKLYIVSSYRSVSYQRGLFNTFSKRDGEEAAERYSARAGFSEHCTGRALDVSNNPSDLDVFAASEEGKWAYENAYKYGFILRYPEGYEDVTGYIYESWHFSYVGTEISNKMHDENIATLEEYVVKYVEHQEK